MVAANARLAELQRKFDQQAKELADTRNGARSLHDDTKANVAELDRLRNDHINHERQLTVCYFHHHFVGCL
jgi:hypothetical protein